MLKVNLHKLANGLPVLWVPMPGTDTVTVLSLIKAGSRLETIKQQGLSHLLEHMLFKGTTNYPTARDLTQVLDGLGADYNAFTSKEYTGYYIKTAAAQIDKALPVQADMLWHSLLNKDELEREKKVIVEEINMYRDNPLMFIGDLLEGELFRGSSLSHLISGSKETVKSLSRHQLLSYWREYYQPFNMVTVVAGNLNNKIKKLVVKNFNQAGLTGHRVAYRRFEPSYTRPRAIVSFKETEQIQLALGFPAYGIGHRAIPAAQLLSVILGGNMSSRLFMRLREREGLCYSVRTDVERYYGTGVFSVQAGLDKTRLSQAVKLIAEELRLVVSKGVSLTELNKAKEYLKGSVILALENSAHQAEWVARRYLLEGQVLNWSDYWRRLSAVTPAAVQRTAKELLVFNKATLALIGPYRSANQWLKFLK